MTRKEIMRDHRESTRKVNHFPEVVILETPEEEEKRVKKSKDRWFNATRVVGGDHHILIKKGNNMI
jgi:hypothetical protein